MKLNRKVAAALLGVMAVLAASPAGVAHATKVNTYTYNYDYWGMEYESPDAYKPVSFTDGKALGTTAMRQPQGMYVYDNMMYVADTGNSRILEILVENGELSIQREITEILDTFGVLEQLPESADEQDAKKQEELQKMKSLTLASPNDMFRTEDGDLYIADTGNYRVLHVNSNLEVIKVITKPDDITVDQNIAFEPSKVVVDRAGRAFVLAKNVNKGLMRFESNGNFIGFVGANEVAFDMMEYLKKLFSTKAQRDQMKDFVPVEYNNLYIDDKSFIYCTTAVFEEADLDAGTAKPIRKLNSLGTDILIRNGVEPPIGDIQWDNAGGLNGPSRIMDITAFEDETYYVVDRIRGRVFAYDEQGHLLYAFGGPGNQLGYFVYPTAIDHVGTDLYVLDSTTAGITRFTRTPFGDLIHSALDEYKLGHYEEAAVYWEDVLKLNGNYELAYIGIGRSLLRQEDYKGAMEYFEVKRDSDNYSRAWKYFRKDWIENNMGYVIIVLAVLILIPSIVKLVKKIRWEAREEYEYELKQNNK